MRKNPFLKCDRLIIKKVYGNKATLKMRVSVKTYDQSSGSYSQADYIFQRTVYIRNPHEIVDALVDNKLYFKGDLNTEIAWQEVADCIEIFPGDPVIIDIRTPKHITDFRTPNSRNGGIDETTDTLVFDGTEYRIVKVSPKQFYAGLPSRLKLLLRAV